MASEVTTMTRKRRKFSKEFKLETVKLVKEGPRSVGGTHRMHTLDVLSRVALDS